MTEKNLTAPTTVGSGDWLGDWQDLQSEIHPCEWKSGLNFGEVSVETFVEWYNARKAIEIKHGHDGQIPISNFDLISVMSMFEDWVKSPNIRS